MRTLSHGAEGPHAGRFLRYDLLLRIVFYAPLAVYHSQHRGPGFTVEAVLATSQWP